MAVKPTTMLRMREVAITHFRTFTRRTVIPLGEGRFEPVVVMQGDNGAGKSAAIAALDFFFKAAIACLAAGASGGSDAETRVRWDLLTSVGHRDLLVRRRDRPVGVEGPTEIEVQFTDADVGSLRVRVEPGPDDVLVKIERDRGKGYDEPVQEECVELLPLIETPLGPGSRPLAVLTARRRALWLPDEPPSLPLHSGLTAQLFRLRTSLDPSDRRRWRSFVEALARFDAFAGKEVSVERLDAGGLHVVIEEPNRVVLPLAEVSAGEQQLVALVAALHLCRASVLVVEKPEIGLDARHQRAAQELLEAQARAGQVGQVILESNMGPFARGFLLRLSRQAGASTTVERGAEVAAAPRASAAIPVRAGAAAR